MVKAVLGPRRLLSETSAFDMGLAVALALLFQFEIWLPSFSLGTSYGPKPVNTVVTLLAALALIFRRRYSLQIVAFVTMLMTLKGLLWPPSADLGYFLPLVIGAYSVGRYHARGHEVSTLWPTSLLVVGAEIIHDLRVPEASRPGLVATYYLILLAAWPVGRAIRVRDVRALKLEQERDAAAAEAVHAERARIARELHDVVAHAVSVVLVQAQAGQEIAASKPDLARRAFTNIEQTAREAVSEMRRMVGILGADDSHALEPLPGLSRIEALAPQIGEAGLAVSIETEGEPRSLTPGLELCAYRVIQEALTNVLGHSGAREAAVLMRWGSTCLEISVTNHGPANAGTGSLSAGGRGLIGMHERVELYGGRLEVGFRPDGGFAVRATLPIELGA